MKNIKIREALFLLIILLLIPGDTVFACTCMPPGTIQEEFENADYVFWGRVTSVDLTGPSSYSISVQVIRFWKGIGYKTIIFKENNCPISPYTNSSFSSGEDYVIYADGYIPNLSTSICSRIVRHDQIKDEIEALGEGEKPTLDLPIKYLHTPQVVSISLLIVFLDIILGFIIYIILKKNKREIEKP